jgi:UDP-glucose 4-epimerase
MTENEVVLVTGVAGHWGTQVAARLADDGNGRIIGLDVKPPAKEIEGLDFILADVRNPLVVELLRAEKVTTVCHLAFVHSTRRCEAAFDANVMGTSKLLGACAEAGVHRVVLKSSIAVYGARPTNSAFLAEEHPLQGSRRYGYTRDMVEIEKFCNGFRRREPQMMLTVLRFSSIIGPRAHTPMTRFLRNPRAPSLMGFDPMMQIIHEDDVVAALVQAIRADVPGVFNVAAEEPLPLSRIRGLVGKLPLSVFHPFASWGVGLLGNAGHMVERHLPMEPDYLRYPWVGDLTQMHKVLGFEPRYAAGEILREFAAQLRLGRYRTGAESLASDDQQLRDVIERRRRAKEGEIAPARQPEAGGNDDE